MEGSDNTSRSRLNGRTNDEASSEIDQRVDSAERDRVSQRLIGADTTPDISKPAMHSLMSSRKIGSRMGSVNPASSSQNFRFQSLTVSRPETTPISSPSFAGFPYNKDAEEEKSDEDGFRGRVGTSAGSNEKIGGDPTFYKDGETRPSDQYEYAAEWGLLIIRFRPKVPYYELISDICSPLLLVHR